MTFYVVDVEDSVRSTWSRTNVASFRSRLGTARGPPGVASCPRSSRSALMSGVCGSRACVMCSVSVDLSTTVSPGDSLTAKKLSLSVRVVVYAGLRDLS